MINIQQSITKKYPTVQTLPEPITFPLFSIIKKVIHENDINTFLKQQQYATPFSFVESTLDYFNFSYKYASNQIENIPSSGRVVIIANHPLGGLDAISLIHLVRKVRSDVKVVANDILGEIQQLEPILIGIDSLGDTLSKSSVNQIHQSLQKEEAIIIFPAGEVSRARPNGIKDTKWHKGFLKFATKNKAPILPIYIKAKNSTLFYTLSSINKSISSLLLPHEMFKQRNGSLEFKIGEIIPYKSFSTQLLSVNAEIKLFRKHLYRVSQCKKPIFPTQKAIAHPENRQILRKDLEECPILGRTSDGKKIYLYEHKKGSTILQEIARLREYTFRKVEEGTGKKRDKDDYDYYYKHIILWDDKELEIVGSYRIAESNDIYNNYGIEGFYTNSLFKLKSGFEPYLNNSIELGRSFVQPKYWGTRALDYLWQGIGAYLYKNPHIKYLFGAVSLSGAMPINAQELIIYYYDKYYGDKYEYIEAKDRFKFTASALDDLKFIFDGESRDEDFSTLKEQLSYYGVTIPTLYKQYSDLCEEGGVSFMGYSIDKHFGNCIDSFLLVDIDKMKEKKRSRYIKDSFV